MSEVLVIIPTYNEKENIQELVKSISKLPFYLDILIVDDNSPDGTGEIADLLSAKYNNVKVTHRKAKLGLGTAYIEGFKFAMNNGYGYVMTMDSDFSHDPKYIPDFLKIREDCDIIIGSRYIRNGGVENWSIVRKIISVTANTLARILLGLKNKDCTAGFRLYNTKVLKNKDILENFHSNGYSFLLEILYKCKQRGFTAKEIPIIYNDRRVGVSKISRIEIFKAIHTLIKFGLGRNFEKWLR